MKKTAVALFCLLLTVTLCGCKSGIGDLLSDFGKSITDIVEKTGVLNETGTFVTQKIDGKKVEKIQAARVTPNGITTVYYESLNEYQQTIYRYLLTSAEEMPEGWFYCGKASSSFETDVSVAYKAMLCDNPQIFWMPASYLIAKSSNNLCVSFKADTDDIYNDYYVTRQKRDEMRPILSEKVNRLTSMAQEYYSDYEKELFIHDYLCNFSTYNEHGGELIYSSWGALVEGVCVCEGYSRAMQLIMQQLGIKCTLVYGEYEGEGHMWNCVNVGGGWYHVDITWDKSESWGALHSFFNLTDEQIQKDHIISPLYTPQGDYSDGKNFNMMLFECASTEYNYFEQSGMFLTDDYAHNAEILYAEHLSGATFAELKDVSSIPLDQTLSITAGYLRGRLSLKSYTARKNEVIVFFENTY